MCVRRKGGSLAGSLFFRQRSCGWSDGQDLVRRLPQTGPLPLATQRTLSPWPRPPTIPRTPERTSGHQQKVLQLHLEGHANLLWIVHRAICLRTAPRETRRLRPTRAQRRRPEHEPRTRDGPVLGWRCSTIAARERRRRGVDCKPHWPRLKIQT